MSIQFHSVNKSYHDHIVFDHLSLEIPSNQITAIIAPSGKGKTTLIHLILGLILPDSETISQHDNQKYSVVFQEDRLLEELSVFTNIILPTPSLKKEVIIKAMNAVDLTCSYNKKVCVLSGGMKRRIALLRAILATSDVLILNEPFKGLDKSL